MQEKYQILARKYRPQTFNEVISQEAIVTTIKNSIRLKRLAHAYLFSGSRGTGKTTLARLFAKTLNCTNITNEYEPCNECKSCKDIATSRSLDVIEIDGASNRGIDDIRQINDTIGYAPSSNYKIYIIDEVHMLTKEAFNALLKTLEEPPEKIKFFFATTEAHKVLPTIISRCQRFELKRISHDQIVKKLSSIAKDLNREIEDEALHLISQFSDGSLRDAESLLDQILCYQEEKITQEHINNALGFIPKDYFFSLDKATKEDNINFAFEFVDKMFKAAKDTSYLIEELIEHYRNILILKLNNESLTNLSENLKNQYLQVSDIYSEDQCLYILDLLTLTLQQIAKSSFKKINFEMLLLKIIKSKNRIPIDSLVKRLIDIENNIPTDKQANIPAPVQEIQPITTERQPITPTPVKEIPPQVIEKPEPIKETPKPVIEKPIVEKTQKVELSNISFNVEKTKPLSNKKQSHYETLMRFAAIELEGTHKNQGE